MNSGSIKFPVDVSPDYKALFDAATPASAFIPEAVPGIIYDTQDFTTNWTNVAFFSTPNSDKTLTNIQQPNTMPGEQYFMLYAVTVDILAGAAGIGTTTPDQYNDFRIIQDTARAILTMSIADKMMFQIPLRACHSAGGVWAQFQGTPATNFILNTVQNMPADGMFWCDGAIILPPKQTFTMQVTGVASALTATRKLQLAMHGVLYRPVR